MADLHHYRLWPWVILLVVGSSAVTSPAQDAAQQAFQQGYAQQTGIDATTGAEGKPNLDLALRYYAQALRLQPQFFEAHANAGQIYYERRSYRRAKYHFSEAIRLARARDDVSAAEEAAISSNLGSCYFQDGELQEAERWLRGAIGLDSSMVEAHYNLINLLLRKKQIDAARQQLALAQQQAPSDRYGIFVGRLKTQESYADWNPTWLKFVIGIVAVVGIALAILRGVAVTRRK